MTHLVPDYFERCKKSLNELISNRNIQKLSDNEKQELYRDVFNGLFKVSNSEVEIENCLSDADKLLHFDLMKGTLIKIGKLVCEKFKQLDNSENDEKEIKLIQVLNDTIDHPITVQYLIPNLCECTYSSIEFMFRHLNRKTKIIDIKIENQFDRALNSKSNERLDQKLNAGSTVEEDRNRNENLKKIYKIYSSNETSEYYESKSTIIGQNSCEQQNLLADKKIDAIALESNKLHQLNQQYRRNQEEMQNELANLKEKYQRLINELETKNLMIEEKQNQFEGMELELSTIRVQLESIYKQNQLLDSDKSNLSNSASSLQKRIQELEKQNDISRTECLKLKQLISERERQIDYLEKEFAAKKANIDRLQIHIKKVVDEEQKDKRLLEQQEKEIKSKYEKIIEEFEIKQEVADGELMILKEETSCLRSELEENVQEIFKLNLELKECKLRVDNLNRDKGENENLLTQCREKKIDLIKRLSQNVQELNRLKKRNTESEEQLENNKMECEKLRSDLDLIRAENVQTNAKLLYSKNENIKKMELTKKLLNNEMNDKKKLTDELLDNLKSKCAKLNEEKTLFLRLFNYLENIFKENQQLPSSLSSDGLNQNIQSFQFEHYLDLIKEIRNQLMSRQLEVNRSKESTRLIEKEYEEQKHFLEAIQIKLNSNNSQLKIKECELIHMRDELAEQKIQRNAIELEKMGLMKENENLKSEKSELELLIIELKKQVTNHQLRNVEIENDLQIHLNKVIELEKLITELNTKHQQLTDELANANEHLVESSSAKDQLERELDALKKNLKETEQSYQNERELNSNLNQIHEQTSNERNRIEKELHQLKLDNQQLEYDLNKIEKEFKLYGTKYISLIDDRSFLIDLLSKYSIILKSHLNVSLELNENCYQFQSNSKSIVKFVKPDCLIQVLFDLQNKQSEYRRQIESLKVQLNENRMRAKEEIDLNQQYKNLIEFNENSLLAKKTNYEKLIKEQKDFKIKLDQTLEENERLKIEKSFLTEKVLSLDKILDTTKEFMERKYKETLMTDDDKTIEDRKIQSLDQYLNSSLDQHDDVNLEDVELRLIYMHDCLTDFIDVLIKSIGDYREKVNQLTDVNKALNDRLNEINQLLDKSRDKEICLKNENEKTKEKLNASEHHSEEIDNRVKQMTNQIIDLQNECLALQNSLESNRLTMNELIETNDRLKFRIRQLEATINLCEIKIKESEQKLCKRSDQVIGRESEIIHLKTSQNHMQDELKKLQLQNKIMNNEINQTLIRTPSTRYSRFVSGNSNLEENLNKFITLNPLDSKRSLSTSNLNAIKHKKVVRVNLINK